MGQLRMQLFHQCLGQHHQPILVTLATVHHDCMAVEIHILDVQTQRLKQTQAAATQQDGHQRLSACHETQHRRHFPHRQHERNAFALNRSSRSVESTVVPYPALAGAWLAPPASRWPTWSENPRLWPPPVARMPKSAATLSGPQHELFSPLDVNILGL